MNPGLILTLVALFGCLISLVLVKAMLGIKDEESVAFLVGCNTTCIAFTVLGAVMWAAS